MQEVPIEGYVTTYSNTEKSGHADVTDRCYNGGTIINRKLPKTGDGNEPAEWAAIGGASLLLLVLLLIENSRKRNGEGANRLR